MVIKAQEGFPSPLQSPASPLTQDKLMQNWKDMRSPLKVMHRGGVGRLLGQHLPV